MPSQLPGTEHIVALFNDAAAHAENGDIDAACMVANQASEEWEQIRAAMKGGGDGAS